MSMEPVEMVLVRTNTTGNNLRYDVLAALETTPDGWVLAGEANQGDAFFGTWFSPDNILKRWTEKSGKFDHNAIPLGSLAVRLYREYDPREGKAKDKKFIGLVVEKRGAKYKLMRGNETISAPWQSVRPFTPELDGDHVGN
jgi:hypothetical protein